jgi:FkbM family methyltransferase
MASAVSLRERCFNAYIRSATIARRLAMLLTFGLMDRGVGDPRGTSELIRQTYRSLLARDPEPSAVETWTVLLNSRQKEFSQFLTTLLESPEFATRASDLLAKRSPAQEMALVHDHSQYGEVRLLMREMINAAAKYRILVDVGANSVVGSNSFDLLKYFGWRGLLIEPNVHLTDEINAAFAGLDSALVNVAVSDYEGTATLHLGVTSAVSSLNRGSVEQWGETRGEMRVPVHRLPPILESHDIPRDFDLLSLDSEGEDAKILNDVYGSGYRPRWVIIEAFEASKVKSLAELPLQQEVVDSYSIVAQTYANLVLKSNQAQAG